METKQKEMTYPPLRKREMAEKGRAVYRRIKDELEKEHKGELVAIDVDSGDYFLGETPIEATTKGREKYPDKSFYVMRIGHRAVYHFSGPVPVRWGL
ncbi:MAG: hypothetical protein QME81_08885 [bacterium]|nr:hypothetical protein [bacterium]